MWNKVTGGREQSPFFCSPFFAVSASIRFPVCLFIVLSKTSCMVFCYYCDIFAFLVAAWLLNCFLISWHLGLLGNPDRTHCGVIMKECAVSQHRLAPPLTYFVSHMRTRSSSICLLFLYFQNAPVTVFGCWFIRRTICWSCVFFLRMPFPWHAASHGGALPIIWCTREAQREPLAATQRRRLCVFAPGSLSARGRTTARAGESLSFSSPHYSFGQLISSSLWPADLRYFMAHFRISASLYVQANRHLQEGLYSVISVVILCSTPCKKIK